MSPRCALLLLFLLLLLRPVTSARRVSALRDIYKSRKRGADLPPELVVNQVQPNSTGNTTSYIQVSEKHQQALRHTEQSRFVQQETKATTALKQQQQQQRFPHQQQHDWQLQGQHFNKKRQQLEPALMLLQQQRSYALGQLSSTSATASPVSRSMHDCKRPSRGSGPKSQKDTTLHPAARVPAVAVPSLLRTAENYSAEANRASSFVHAATRAAQPASVPAKPTTGETSPAPAAAATVATQQKAATEAALQQQALAAAAQQQAAAVVAQQQQQLQAAQAQQQLAAATAAQAQQQLAAATAAQAQQQLAAATAAQAQQQTQQQAAAAERQREAILAAALPQAEQETAAELAKVSQALGVPPVTVVVTPSMAAAAAAQAGQPLTSEQVLAIQTAAEAHAAEQLREAVTAATAVGAAAAAAAPNSQKKQSTSAVEVQIRSMTVATHMGYTRVRSIMLFLLVTVWLI